MASSKMLHVVMYPWFAYGHMIPYLHLANKLAERGHQVTYILPNKAKSRLQLQSHSPSLITFRTITVPHVPPLPLGAENVSDIPDLTLHTHLATALDLTRPEFESIVTSLEPSPDLILYDLAYWVPLVAPQLGIKFVCYNVVSAHSLIVAQQMFSKTSGDNNVSFDREKGNSADFMSNYPKVMEEQDLNQSFGKDLSFIDRLKAMMSLCDVIAYRTCREVEGEDCDELSRQYSKPVLLAGPFLLDLDEGAVLEARWSEWLGKFEVGSVVFCAFGSQFSFEKEQFHELLLGLEMMELPFLLATMPPSGYSSIEEAYPEGFKERVGDRGVVTSEWVQQQLMLAHPSVGCFVNHCGFGTMWESLLSKNQIVVIPQLGDQVVNAKMLAEKMKVAVEVERSDGWMSKESLCNAIKSVMDKNNEIGVVIKKNHQIWREKLGAPGFMEGYIDTFINELQSLCYVTR